MKGGIQISVTFIILFQLHVGSCFKLSDAPYPAYLANPQRTGAVNKPVLCPNVSQGRTTVLRQTTVFSTNGYINQQPVMDADGSIYAVWLGDTNVLYKLDANLNIVKQVNLPSSADAPIILDEGILVPLTNAHVILYSKTDLTQIASWTLPNAASYLLPVGNMLLAGTSSNGFYLFNTTTTLTIAPLGFVTAVYNNVIYGIDQDTVQIFESPDGVTVNKYTPPLTLIDFSPSIFGDQLVAFSDYTAHLLNLVSHQFTSIPTPNFASNPLPKFYQDGKLYYASSCSVLGSCLAEATTGTVYNALASQELIYSVTDDVLLTGGSTGYVLAGLHLASNQIKLVYEAPPSKKRALAQPLAPLIGDNCAIYYPYGSLYKIEPMPLQRIIPILECIDTLGRMYFTYRSLENDTVIIPRVSDRNNISPLDATPFTSFNPGRVAPYPVSNFYLQLANNTDVYTWYLEDYELTFSKNNPALKCPKIFKLLLTIRSDRPIRALFLRVIERVIAFVTGISAGRIRLEVFSSKRGLMLTDELVGELTVYPTNSTTSGEPSSEEIVQSLVSDQAASVNAALLNTELPDTSIIGVEAKQLDNSIEGQQVLPPNTSPSTPTTPGGQQTPNAGTSPSSSATPGVQQTPSVGTSPSSSPTPGVPLTPSAGTSPSSSTVANPTTTNIPVAASCGKMIAPYINMEALLIVFFLFCLN